MFYFLYALLWVFTLLPLRVIYLFSDMLTPVLYHIIRYRRKVVRKNLLNSFPEKSAKEIKSIERDFYRYFCDLFLETLYQINMSETEMRKRVEFVNVEAITAQYAQGRSALMMTAHYGNWEWLSAASMWLPKDKPAHNVYKGIRDKGFDNLLYKLRAKFGNKNIETQQVFRTMLQLKNNQQFTAFGMISDQTPTASSTRHWMTFLNQDTPVIVGTEQLARKFNYPVMFINTTRLKRGYYRYEMVMIEENPKNCTEFEITEKYMRLLEAKICAAPQFWLWTHKRWKHKRPESL